MIDVILIVVIAAAVVAALAHMFYMKKHGKGCSGCAYSGTCRRSERNHGCHKNRK